MNVGIGGSDYPEKRNIKVNALHSFTNLKTKNIYTYINKVRTCLLRKNKIFLFRTFPFVNLNSIDILHHF